MPARYAVNAPVILPETMAMLEPFMKLAACLEAWLPNSPRASCAVSRLHTRGDSVPGYHTIEGDGYQGLLQPVLRR